MEHYWQECLRLPQRIQEWDAYKEMRDAIKNYLDVFPTLHKLNSKVGSFTWQAMFRKGKLRKYKQANKRRKNQNCSSLIETFYRYFHKLLPLICCYISIHLNVVRAVIKGWGPGIFTDNYERDPRPPLWENRRKIEPNKIPSCLIRRLLVSCTRHLEILMTALM